MGRLLKMRVFHLSSLILLGIVIYSNTLNVPLVFDDIFSISENDKLKYLSEYWPPSGSRWAGFLTFALNYYFGGLDTFGYHLVNISIHIVNAVLVYLFVLFLFETPYLKRAHSSWLIAHGNNEPRATSYDQPALIAFFSAMLFVSHPVQTQAVTYIVQRFASLATMFYLLSLVLYIKARFESEVKAKFFSTSILTFYLFSLLSAVLAMKTKEISFTLPFIIVLCEVFFFNSDSDKPREQNLKRFLYLLPFLLTLLIIPLNLVGINKPAGDVIGELREAAKETESISRWSYFLTQLRVIVTYIRLLFMPINQNLDYDYPIYHSFFEPAVFLSFLFLLLIFAFGIYLFYAKRYTLYASRFLSFGLFWFFITLSIESSIIPIKDVIFEHRLYLPSVGVFIAITALIFSIPGKTGMKVQAVRKVLVSLFMLFILLLSVTAYARNNVWRDEVSLWGDVVSKSPRKARVYLNRASMYIKNFRSYGKAIEDLTQAITINPAYAEAYNNRGIAYALKADFSKAAEDLTVAINLSPGFSGYYINRAQAYYDSGRHESAIKDFRKACELGNKGGCEALERLKR